MSQNIMVPLSLLIQIIELLDQWDLSEYGPTICDDYNNVFGALTTKKRKIELRHSYAKILGAADDEARDEARIQYLQQKRACEYTFEAPF